MTDEHSRSDRRLIETWLPIAALGEESVRERHSMTALPPTYYLHVWWARRPLVASRAAVLASLLPADADRERFLHILGIHGDPVEAKQKMDIAKRTGNRIANPYGYDRAFKFLPSTEDKTWLREQSEQITGSDLLVLDPTAGGGSIPFEAARLGLSTISNELNPVATLILNATIKWPLTMGFEVLREFDRIATEFRRRVETPLSGLFPPPRTETEYDQTYLWSRTITCPYCEGMIPLSPNWRLAPDGTGVKIILQMGDGPGSTDRHCTFEIVNSVKEQSEGTVSGGDAVCPYPDCGRLVDGDDVKRQAQAGQIGEQLYAIVVKRKVVTQTKTGRKREKWVRGYRAPRPDDDVSSLVAERLAENLPEWETLDIIPNELIPDGNKTVEPIRYGMMKWIDIFSPRQLLGHGFSVEVIRELLDEEQAKGILTDATKAAFGYLAFVQDKMLNYNARLCRWDITTSRVRSVFDTHNFAFVWSYAEMAPLIVSIGYDWAIKQTAKCIRELIELTRPDLPPMRNGKNKRDPNQHGLDLHHGTFDPPEISITCKSADSLDHIADGAVDAVIIDPPYYANVMYAELSDFFYVWLKRTAGYVYPELFRRPLTDKENEAVANVARFKGHKSAKKLAGRDYQQRMAAIFAECRRVLKPNGIMTVMFTHKETDAWDALTKGMMEAGFTITASWPVNTEAEGSMHIRNKAAASSTIFLVCRPRDHADEGGEALYWEDVEPRVAKAVRARITEFEAAGIRGVDLYLASFGPALEEFSRHWPLKRGTPRPVPEERKRRKQHELFDEDFDPYAATPEDALEAARREVKQWRLEQLTHRKARADLDPLTAWFVLAWDAFKAPQFPYDEALRLARACGVDLDDDVVRKLVEKKGSNLVMWDSAKRAAKGSLGPADGSRGMIDAIHHAAYAARNRTLNAARELLEEAGVASDPMFLTALEAVLEVLPVSKTFTGIDEPSGIVADAASDFEALEMLRRLAFQEQVDEPTQLEFWKEEAA